MAATKAEKNQLNEDITVNLPSLQFESALTDDERHCLSLRARTHALTVSACAQATYFVAILNEARQINAELRNPKQGKAGKLLHEKAPRNPVLVGIIGCGKLGSQLANCLLTYGDVRPEELKISTRRPETLCELQDKGVRCFKDNKKVASSIHVLFLCVLPAQFLSVSEEISGQVSPKCIVYTFILTYHTTKLKQLLRSNNIIKPDFRWDLHNSYKPWDYNTDVNTALENGSTVEKTCPLSSNIRDNIIVTDPMWAQVVIYSFVNTCTQLGLTRTETIDVLLGVLFGYKSTEARSMDITDGDLVTEDASEVSDNDTDLIVDPPMYFPVFDLLEVAEGQMPLQQKLSNDSELCDAFVQRYKHIFRQFIEWKKFSEGLQGMSMAMGM